jgi:hypothetical protein
MKLRGLAAAVQAFEGDKQREIRDWRFEIRD